MDHAYDGQGSRVVRLALAQAIHPDLQNDASPDARDEHDQEEDRPDGPDESTPSLQPWFMVEESMRDEEYDRGCQDG